MTAQSIADQVRTYIIDSFLDAKQGAALRNDTDLLGLLDSLQLLRMVVHLEASFGIKVDDSELTAENLGSVQRIASFLARKHG
jgi:acyl carrier protein